jgi:TonB-linked SusC/RagA family outer membrane protein
MKRVLLTFCVLGMVSLVSYAQEQTVKGKVTSATDGSTLPGVNVVVKGSTTGTVTDVDGNYTMPAPPEGTLIFSFIGLQSQEVSIGGRSTVDVQMSEDVKQLNEVVVTGQGIQVEKRAVGFSIASVSGQSIQQKPETDIARLLNGKVAGVNITSTSGVAGTGSNIIIRGYTTITGSKQPLFVVDGVPFNSNTNASGDADQGFLYGNQAATSRFLDLDPNNIDNIEVLKGLAAAVLYGQAGRNGVILITTKNSKTRKNQNAQITLNQSVYLSELASVPEYSTKYGSGFQQNWGWFYSNWGPAFSQLDSVSHPFNALQDAALKAQFPQYLGKNVKYQAYDNTKFFRKGVGNTTSLNVNGGTEHMSYNATAGYTDENGFTPGNNLKKLNFGTGINAEISKKLTFSTTLNFASTEQQTPPISAGNGSGIGGSGVSIFSDVFYTPTSVDLMGWPFESPIDHKNVYYRSGGDIQNPRWTATYTKQTDDVKRIYGRTQAEFAFTKELKLTYRVGLDLYRENQEYIVNKGGPQLPNGMYRTTSATNILWNHDLILGYDHNFGNDVTFKMIVGGNIRQDKFMQDGMESTNQIVFGFINHANFTAHSNANSFTQQKLQFQTNRYIEGIYGSAIVGYKDYLYLNLQARNDWASTVEKANRSITYPSASLSFVPTTAFNLESQNLNSIKLRVGYGTSAGFPEPYNTRSYLASNGLSFKDSGGNPVVTNAVSGVLGNANLKPELQGEIETGIEGQFLQNRLGVDLTLYKRNTTNLITSAPLDPSTGYNATSVNVGKISNKGLELAINGTPIRTSDFSWDLTLNYYAYRSMVDKLGVGLQNVLIAGYTNLGNFAIEGKPFNSIMGNYVVTDPNGQRIVQANGDYLPSQDIKVIGNPNPKFTSSLISSFTYKGINLSFQFDYRYGGDIYSTTISSLFARGVTRDTDFDRSKTIIMPGVTAEGNPNTVQTTASDAYFNNIGFGPSDLQIYDGTTIRLRQLSVGYSLPKSLLEHTPFKEISLSLMGQNLWFNAVNTPKHMHFDTDNAGTGVGNGLGMDFLTGPSARKFGANLRIRF